jgi:hypothetical protein
MSDKPTDRDLDAIPGCSCCTDDYGRNEGEHEALKAYVALLEAFEARALDAMRDSLASWTFTAAMADVTEPLARHRAAREAYWREVDEAAARTERERVADGIKRGRIEAFERRYGVNPERGPVWGVTRAPGVPSEQVQSRGEPSDVLARYLGPNWRERWPDATAEIIGEVPA